MVEFIIASVASVLILTTVLAILLFPYRAWGEAVANFYLDHRIRIVRERILRGIDGKYGLRAASLSSIEIQPGETTQVEWIDFDIDDNDIPTEDQTNDDVTCRVIVTPGLGLSVRTTPGSGQPKSLLRPKIKVSKFQVTQNDRKITVVLALSTSWGGKTFTREQNFDVYIRND
ncbi:MAG: hypothetical protein GXP31_13960 [Kiritimatiellaeota bacterium]|nr:hypothetical protein [Kiritimatiellota bacterium]